MKKTLLSLIGGAALLAAGAVQAEGTQTPISGTSLTPAIASSTNNPNAPVKGRNSFTESQARERMAKAGYTNITNLYADKNGIWQATATMDGQTRKVMLDYQGNLTFRTAP